MAEFDNIIVLNDEDGNEVEFEFLDLIEYQDKKYVVLMPVDDEDEVVILMLEPIDGDNDKAAYVSVEDNQVLQAVFEIFKEKFKDEFDFTDN